MASASRHILTQWFHQSKRSRSGVGLGPVQSNRRVGLDRATDLQSWTGRAWSGPVQGSYYWLIVLVHSRRRLLRGVPSQFKEAHLPWTNRPFTEFVPHLRQLTSSFAESVTNYKYSALHTCMCMHWHVLNCAALNVRCCTDRIQLDRASWVYVHSSQRNWVRSTDSIVLTIWTALHLPSHIKFRHSKRVAIENLLFKKLLIFSPLLSSSKYIVGVKATARQFVANVSEQKPSAHFIGMAEMVVRSA